MDIPLRQWPLPVRLLLVLAEPEPFEDIRLALGHSRFEIRSISTSSELADALQRWHPHLGIVDLEAGDGLMDFLDRTTPRADRIPIIGLTRRGDILTKLAAFDRGMDDVLSVPFHPAELSARIVAVLRRAYHATALTTYPLCLGDVELDTRNRRIRIGSREVRLSALDQGLLYLLVANAGHVLSRDEILDELWGAGYVADSNVVDRHIRNLRIKLHDDWRQPRYIATVPGRGYRFVVPTSNT